MQMTSATSNATPTPIQLNAPSGADGYFLIDEHGALAVTIGRVPLRHARAVQLEYGLTMAYTRDGIIAALCREVN